MYKWPLSIAMLVITRGYLVLRGCTRNRQPKKLPNNQENYRQLSVILRGMPLFSFFCELHRTTWLLQDQIRTCRRKRLTWFWGVDALHHQRWLWTELRNVAAKFVIPILPAWWSLWQDLLQDQWAGHPSNTQLVGGLEHFLFSICWESSSQLTSIFRWIPTTN